MKGKIDTWYENVDHTRQSNKIFQFQLGSANFLRLRQLFSYRNNAYRPEVFFLYVCVCVHKVMLLLNIIFVSEIDVDINAINTLNAQYIFTVYLIKAVKKKTESCT